MLRRKVDRPIAAHFGSGCCHVRSDPEFDRGMPAGVQIAESLCDGFVMGGTDVEAVREDDRSSDFADLYARYVEAPVVEGG